MTDTIENDLMQKPEPPSLFRWGILLVISFAMFGNYYIYNSIIPLADILAEQLNFSDANIGMLQGIYNLPNIVMVLISGIIIDKIGTRLSTFIFTFICLIGAVLTAVSPDLTIMASGRLVFGLGAESMIVAISTVIGKWFKGKQLSFAFGLNLTLARLGTFTCMNSPSWAGGLYDNWQDPLFLAVGAGVIAVICIVFYWRMDRYAEKNYSLAAAPKQEKFVPSQIFKFPKSYWYVVLLCVTFYSGIFPFETFAVKYFIHAHNTTREFGGFILSTLSLSAMFLTPLFGLFSDYFGKRSLLMMIGSILLIPVYLLLAYTDINLYIPMIMMGISFSLIPAVMWPSVAIIVEESKLGTAFGLMTMIQNIGMGLFNMLIGEANDYAGAGAANPDGYNLGLWLFSILGFLGLLFAFLLRKSETGPNNHGLEQPAGTANA